MYLSRSVAGTKFQKNFFIFIKFKFVFLRKVCFLTYLNCLTPEHLVLISKKEIYGKDYVNSEKKF